MKALLLSIKPEHVINILNGKKTLELSKSVPKGFKGWVYCYVTKGKPILWDIEDVSGIDFYGQRYLIRDENLTMSDLIYTGKKLNATIPFRFWFDEYEEVPRTDYTRKQSDTGLIPMMKSNGERYYERICVNLRVGYEYDDCEDSCLTNAEIKAYGKGKDLYAWRIKNVDIFSEPMKLSNFITTIIPMSMLLKGEYIDYKTITKAPQSYMFVYVRGEKGND